MLKVGFSRLSITPPCGILMGGHPGTKRSQGVLDELYAQAMVVKNKQLIVVFIAVNVLFLDNRIVSNVRDVIARTSGICRENIFINATHTHSGPLTVNLFGLSKETSYVDKMQRIIVDTAYGALKNIKTARIGFGKTDAEGLAFNARFLMTDGEVQTHPMKGSPDIVESEGPVDNELVVFYAVDMQGNFLGALINFACHPQVMERKNVYISADFPGYIEKKVREELKCSAVILFGNGACGNICPVNAADTEHIEVGQTWAERMGNILADRFISVCQEMLLEKDIEIKIKTTILKIPIRDIPDILIKKAKEFFRDYKNKQIKEIKLSDYGTEISQGENLSLKDFLKTPFWKEQQYKEILTLAREKKKFPAELCEISVVLMGDNAIVMVPFELFVEYGLQIKEKSPYKNTMVIELANGYSGYIPTKKAFSKPGGYETVTLRSSKLVPEAGEIVVNEVEKLFCHLRNVE